MDSQTSKLRILREETVKIINDYVDKNGTTHITNVKINGWYENLSIFPVGNGKGFRFKTDLGIILYHDTTEIAVLCLIADMLKLM